LSRSTGLSRTPTNVPYDSGIALCAHPESHRAAMTVHAEILNDVVLNQVPSASSTAGPPTR
jgi:hypothetical protein